MLKFLEDYKIHPALAIFPEPGLQIANGHHGVIEVNFKVRGKSGHAARPQLGKNAVLGGYRAVEHLLQIFEQYHHPALGKTTWKAFEEMVQDVIGEAEYDDIRQ